MNIYVGNLPWEIQEEELRKSFEEFGQVASATIIKDKFTNKPRGFGFVEMPEKEEALAAIKALNWQRAERPPHEGQRGQAENRRRQPRPRPLRRRQPLVSASFRQ